MQFLRSLGWIACVIYSTIPLFWLMIHPRAQSLRARPRSPYRVLLPAWITMWIALAALTAPWRNVEFYSTPWTWLPAALMLTAGTFTYRQSGAHFSWSQLCGLPEVHGGTQNQRLVTTGIRARVRHPVYLGHLCEMLAWSLGTGLAVCWLLTAFAIATGAVMIRMEDAELEKRFGDEFRKYRHRVRAVLPQVTTNQMNQRPRLLSDGVVISHEAQDHEIWQIVIAELTCVGEYTNDNGPWDDDYFLVFGVKTGLWYEAPFNSDGRDETIEVLGKALDCDLHFGLIQSTSFASRIIWPKELEGKPLIVEKRVNPKLERLGKHRPL
jgi:protein-S-isoprenylcysteine O-methyltransferase Ste14